MIGTYIIIFGHRRFSRVFTVRIEVKLALLSINDGVVGSVFKIFEFYIYHVMLYAFYYF